jgi:hypothetical protein
MKSASNQAPLPQFSNNSRTTKIIKLTDTIRELCCIKIKASAAQNLKRRESTDSVIPLAARYTVKASHSP